MVANAVLNITGTCPGGSAEVTCNHGYTLEGSSNMTCDACGNWTGDAVCVQSGA